MAAMAQYYAVARERVNIHFTLSALGPVKKCGLLKIVHEKYRVTGGIKKGVNPEVQEFRLTLQEAAESNPEIAPYIDKAQVRADQWVVCLVNLLINFPLPSTFSF